jgi:pilus assembly protein CpaB
MSNDGNTGTTRLRAASGGASRRSGSRAVLSWGIAAVAGLGGALLIGRYLDQRTVTVGAPTAKIVVAAVDLPMATRISADQLKLAEWPLSALPPGAIRDPKEVVDRILIAHVVAGEPVRPAQLAAKDAGNGLAALIPAQFRAMAVRVDDVVGVAGFIHPDDHVDVIVTLRLSKPSDAEPTSKVILQNVKVLAVGKEIEVADQARRQANPVTVATLLVTPRQAERLALAGNEGHLVLTLRSWVDESSVPTNGISPSGLLAEDGDLSLARADGELRKKAADEQAGLDAKKRRAALSRSAPAAKRTPSADGAPAKRDKEVVEILRGDRFEERKFEQTGAPRH